MVFSNRKASSGCGKVSAHIDAAARLVFLRQTAVTSPTSLSHKTANCCLIEGLYDFLNIVRTDYPEIDVDAITSQARLRG
jgi:hypothetical protein